MCVLLLALTCMSWRLGLFVIENVFVQSLAQESLSIDMDKSYLVLLRQLQRYLPESGQCTAFQVVKFRDFFVRKEIIP